MGTLAVLTALLCLGIALTAYGVLRHLAELGRERVSRARTKERLESLGLVEHRLLEAIPSPPAGKWLTHPNPYRVG